MKKILPLLLILSLLLIGCEDKTKVQIFKPDMAKVNDNLLKNSGWWENTDGYTITDGVLDTTIKFNGCNSIKQSSQDRNISFDFGNVKIIPSKKLIFSISLKAYKLVSDSPPYSINLTNNSIIHYADGDTEIGTAEVIEITTNQYTWTLDLANSSRAIDSVDVKVGLSGWHSTYINVYQPKLEYGTQATPWCPSIYDNVDFDYDSLNASFQSQKVGEIYEIENYNYKKSLTDVGLFSMAISENAVFADKIKEDCFLFVDNDDWLVVNDIKSDESYYNITGTDLKGLLKQRITLYDTNTATSTMGFDSVQGSTEYCLKHYVANNIVNPIDSNRAMPLVTLAENKNRGIANDTYMSRLEPLDELSKKMCENADIGYDVFADTANNKIIFDVIDITDKSASQQDRNRVIFSIDRNNVGHIEKADGNSTYKNAFYATKSGGNLESDAVTMLCVRSGETVPTGFKRKEMHLNVSCENASDIDTYAKYQMTEYKKIDSIDIEPADVYNYGKLYQIGDRVTVIFDGKTYDKVIKDVEKTKQGVETGFKLYFGDAKPKPFKEINTKINNKGV